MKSCIALLAIAVLLFQFIATVNQACLDLGSLLETLSIDGSVRAVIVYGSTSAELDVKSAWMLYDYLSTFGGDIKILPDRNVTIDLLTRYHLIVIGGPVANLIAARLNNEFKNARFEFSSGKWYLKFGGVKYFGDDYGFCVLEENPFSNGLYAIWIAGTTRYGTKHAVDFLRDRQESHLGVGFLVKGFRLIKIIVPEKVAIVTEKSKEINFVMINNPDPQILARENVTKCWIIPTNLTGWNIIESPNLTYLPFAGMYNAVLVIRGIQIKEVPENLSIEVGLGVYSVCNGSFCVYKPLQNDQFALKYDNSTKTFRFIAGPYFIPVNEQFGVPWTQGNVTVKIDEIYSNYTAFIKVCAESKHAVEMVINGSGDISFDIGGDGSLTTIKISMVRATPKVGGWFEFTVEFRNTTILNLTDKTVIGDDLNLTLYGTYVEFGNGTLWILKTSNLKVPVSTKIYKYYLEMKKAENEGRYNKVQEYVELMVKEVAEIHVEFDELNWLIAALVEF